MFQFARLNAAKAKNDRKPGVPKQGAAWSADQRPTSFQRVRSVGNHALNNLHVNNSSSAGREHNERDSDSTLRSILRSTKGSGEPLAEPIKTYMEASLHTNLDRVRVHTDPRAVTMAKQLGAEAFTYGRNVYFNSGRFDPTNAKGATLLAHELIHTVQQGFHDGQIPGNLPVSSSDEPTEKQANEVAARITRHNSSRGNRASSIASIKTNLIQPMIQRAKEVDVAVYETKDHGTGYDDAPDEDFKLEANSLNEAGTKLNALAQGLSKVFGPTNFGQLSFYGHGAPGSQSVGAGEGYDAAKEFSVASISSRPNEYKQIYTPLSSGASVYLRGCNVGAGDQGLRLLREVKNSCKTLTGKDIEAYGWTGKSYHMRALAYDWYEQTGARVSGSDQAPKVSWDELKKRGAKKK